MVPELSAHAFTDDSGRVHMLLGTQNDYHRLMGPNLDSLLPEQLARIQYNYTDAHLCTQRTDTTDPNYRHGNYVYPYWNINVQPDPQKQNQYPCDSAPNQDRCDPSKFHSQVFLGPTWTADGSHVDVLIHNEYHGDLWQCDPSIDLNCNGYLNHCDRSQMTNPDG